jgi:hypothetical protein
MRVQRGTRIGQYLSFNAEALHKYDGSYGRGKQHDVKYQTEAYNAQEDLKALGIDIDPALQVEKPEEPIKRKPGRPFGTTKTK